jgi:hypothetical protein
MAYRVLIAQFMHETNTFSKLKTTLEDYRKRWLIEGEEMVPRFTGTRNEVGGYIDSVKKYGWEPVWAAAANATPSGKLTKETWEHIRDLILDAAKKAGKLDAICLSLHGAAVTETEDDAEGALLEALRAIVGPDIPVVATLDLHANATVKMAKHANALVSYRTYPHIDGYDRAVQAAALVQETLKGRKKPKCLAGPAGNAAGRGLRQDHPARPDARPAGQGRQLREGAGASTSSVSRPVSPGPTFPIPGPSVAVSHEPGAEGRAKEVAAALLDEIWKRRTENTSNFRPIAEAIAAAKGGHRQGGTAGRGRRHRQSGRRRLQRHHSGAAGTDRRQGRERGFRYDLRSRHRAAGHQGRRRGGDRRRAGRSYRSHDGRAGEGPGNREDAAPLRRQSFKNDGPMNAGVETSMGPTAVLRIGRHRRGDHLERASRPSTCRSS